MTKREKLDAQFIVATVLIVCGVILLFCGLYIPPSGIIHSSVLVAFGEICTFAGALIGIDYHYRFREFITRRGGDDEDKKEREN